MWQQRLLHQSYKAWTLIGGHGLAGNLIGGCNWRQNTLPADGNISRHAYRQIFAAYTNC